MGGALKTSASMTEGGPCARRGEKLRRIHHHGADASCASAGRLLRHRGMCRRPVCRRGIPLKPDGIPAAPGCGVWNCRARQLASSAGC